MTRVKVCTGNWNGVHGSTFTWHNPDTTNTATISESGMWPFTLASPISVGPGANLSCGLISLPGTYRYNVDPCAYRATSASTVVADALVTGNPKTVIIS